MADNKPITQNEETSNTEKFESDTQKVVRKHLENKDHVISEEEMRNVRVGMTPPKEERASEEVTEDTDNNEKEDKARDEPIVPWDTVES